MYTLQELNNIISHLEDQIDDNHMHLKTLTNEDDKEDVQGNILSLMFEQDEYNNMIDDM